jgi:hypothetical protein
MIKVTVTSRPYTLSVDGTPNSYLLTSIEAQRLIDASTILNVAPNRVDVSGAGERTIIRPATLGGGDAFLFTRASTRQCDTCGAQKPDTGHRESGTFACDACHAGALAHGQLHGIGNDLD